MAFFYGMLRKNDAELEAVRNNPLRKARKNDGQNQAKNAMAGTNENQPIKIRKKKLAK